MIFIARSLVSVSTTAAHDCPVESSVVLSCRFSYAHGRIHLIMRPSPKCVILKHVRVGRLSERSWQSNFQVPRMEDESLTSTSLQHVIKASSCHWLKRSNMKFGRIGVLAMRKSLAFQLPRWNITCPELDLGDRLFKTMACSFLVSAPSPSQSTLLSQSCRDSTLLARSV